MRFEKSPALETAVAIAGGLAQQAQAPTVSPTHLLWALTAEPEGQVCEQLRQAGLAVEAWALSHPPPSGTHHAADWPLSPEVHAMLAEARELAGLHSAEGTITSDQVLLALLRRDIELHAELEQFGLQFDRLEQSLVSQSPPLRLDEPLELSEPREAFDAARVLDANANRAREAMRIAEDYCRFVLADSFLAGEWKRLRHELTQALAEIPHQELLQARNTLEDVGTTLATPQELERESLLAVAQANAKRAQEALRALEEVGKTRSPELARNLESLRYRTYTLEKAMVLGTDSRRRLADARLVVLATSELCRHSLTGTVREALAGGADIIQLREKKADDRSVLALARAVRRLTREAGALFIMNDRPDLALVAEADGVHLGQNDLPIGAARRLLGVSALIGVSTHDLGQVRQAVLQGADYIGVGPTFPSATKEFSALAGLDFVRQATTDTSLPAFVLGGLTLESLDQVLAAGGRRIAVSHAVCAAADPRQASAALRGRLTSAPFPASEKR